MIKLAVLSLTRVPLVVRSTETLGLFILCLTEEISPDYLLPVDAVSRAHRLPLSTLSLLQCFREIMDPAGTEISSWWMPMDSHLPARIPRLVMSKPWP